MPGPSRIEGGYTCDACLGSNTTCYVLLDKRGDQLSQGRKEYAGSNPPKVKGPCKDFNIYRLHPSAPYD